jgi:putative hydrolase of the HAD superfamily
MLKAVLFDLDHTLYDREASLRKMAQPLREALSIPEPVEVITEALLGCERYFYNEDFTYGGAAAIYPHLCHRLTLPEFEAYNRFVIEQLPLYVQPYPFTHSLLEEVRKLGLRVGMVTNGRRSMQLVKIETLGITDLIDHLVCPDDVGVLKPDPAIFLHCAQSLGVRPEACMYVGDNPLDDIQGAIAAGMISAWVRGDRPFPDHLTSPDLAIDSVDELRHILPGYPSASR